MGRWGKAKAAAKAGSARSSLGDEPHAAGRGYRRERDGSAERAAGRCADHDRHHRTSPDRAAGADPDARREPEPAAAAAAAEEEEGGAAGRGHRREQQADSAGRGRAGVSDRSRRGSDRSSDWGSDRGSDAASEARALAAEMLQSRPRVPEAVLFPRASAGDTRPVPAEQQPRQQQQPLPLPLGPDDRPKVQAGYKEMRLFQLQRMCRDSGLADSGDKSLLINSLIKADVRHRYGAQAADHATPHEATVRLADDFRNAGAEWSHTRQSFENIFARDVAAKLDISVCRIKILSVTEGSIVVQFAIDPDRGGRDELSPAQAVQVLQEQVGHAAVPAARSPAFHRLSNCSSAAVRERFDWGADGRASARLGPRPA